MLLGGGPGGWRRLRCRRLGSAPSQHTTAAGLPKGNPRPAVTNYRRAGSRALARFAKREAAGCFERALAALGHLPGSRSTLEQAFDVRMELRPALNQLGNVREVLKHLAEARTLAEQLNDDGRRGQVSAFMAVAHSVLGEVDEAVASATSARQTADRLGI